MPEQKFIAKVISFGRITIPLKVRERLGIKEGDMVEVTVRKVKIVVEPIPV